MSNKIHCITFNTQGLREKQKRNRFYQWVKEQKANIVCIQETHFTKQIIKFINTEWQGDMIHNYGTSQSRGVSILLRKNLNHEIMNGLMKMGVVSWSI